MWSYRAFLVYAKSAHVKSFCTESTLKYKKLFSHHITCTMSLKKTVSCRPIPYLTMFTWSKPIVSQSRLTLKWAVEFYHFMFRRNLKVRKGMQFSSKGLSWDSRSFQNSNFYPSNSCYSNGLYLSFDAPDLWTSCGYKIWTEHEDRFETGVGDSNVFPFALLIWASIWKAICLHNLRHYKSHDRSHVKFQCIYIL